MRNKLYRNSEDAIISGVCAGIADYYNRDIWLIRIVTLTLFLFGGSIIFCVYLAA